MQQYVHMFRAAVFFLEVDPHPILSSTFLVRLINHLDTGFIPMSISASEEFFLHQFIKRLQIPVCTLDDPVRHGLCGKVQVITGKFQAFHRLFCHNFIFFYNLSKTFLIAIFSSSLICFTKSIAFIKIVSFNETLYFNIIFLRT